MKDASCEQKLLEFLAFDLTAQHYPYFLCNLHENVFNKFDQDAVEMMQYQVCDCDSLPQYGNEVL